MSRLIPVLLCLFGATMASAQDLQPRRWGHLPIDKQFGGAMYGYTSADIFFSPTLRIEDGELDMHTFGLSYVRSFEFLGRSGRFDMIQSYQDGRWTGLLNGVSASTSRSGLSDTVLRLSMNLFGAPPLEGKEFVEYRARKRDCETIVGAGVVVVLPTGHYLKERLLNLGSNRFTIRPQFGVIHNRGPWSYELTGSIWCYTDNNSFYNGNKLEQDPLYSLQGHLVYTFRPGFWIGGGAAYGMGGRTSLNDIASNDYKNNFLWGASVGFSLSSELGFRLTYISTRTLERSGFDSDSILFGATLMW